MPESGLNLTVGELRSEVGVYAGFGAGENYADSDWDAAQVLRIERSTKSGIRMVLFTEQTERIPGGYGWSFMKPKASVLLASGTSAVLLPEDFAGLDANVIPASASGESEFPIAVCGPGEIDRERSAAPNDTGRPRLAAQDPIREQNPGSSTRFMLQVYPIADQDYTLQVRYYYTDVAFDSDDVFLPGGAAHAETYKAAVRAAYERDYNNILSGPEWQRFEARMRASIDLDRKLKPLIWGRNVDRSDGFSDTYNPHLRDPNEVMPLTYNGASY